MTPELSEGWQAFFAVLVVITALCLALLCWPPVRPRRMKPQRKRPYSLPAVLRSLNEPRVYRQARAGEVIALDVGESIESQCYFSRDGGVTAVPKSEIREGDQLYIGKPPDVLASLDRPSPPTVRLGRK